MEKILEELIEFTKGCRNDMHEPDEQEVSALVVGDHLDNAMGNQIIYREDFTYQEYVVVLKRKGEGGTKEFKINLATLIALARLSDLKTDRSGSRQVLEERNECLEALVELSDSVFQSYKSLNNHKESCKPENLEVLKKPLEVIKKLKG
jgi:hypothetical protein